jgi:hypothetical protein
MSLIASEITPKQQDISRYFLYVPLRLRIAACVAGYRLKLEVIGFRWNFLEDPGKTAV